MIVPEQVAVLLRALVYAGAIATAGAMLFQASFTQAARAVAPVLRRQILIGFLLLLVVEPLRYGIFQLAIADGDWTLAFGPDLRWMGMLTPIGQAAAVRLIAAAVIVAAGLRWAPIGLTAAFVVIGSFLLEGHTAASEGRLLVAPLLFVHLTAVHWWLGALFPLIAVTRRVEPAAAVATIELFGGRAILVVGGLLAAGLLLVLLLTGGAVRLDSAYQQRLADQAHTRRPALVDCRRQQAAPDAAAPPRLCPGCGAPARLHPCGDRRGRPHPLRLRLARRHRPRHLAR